MHLRVTYTSADVWGSIAEDEGLFRWTYDQWSAYWSTYWSPYRTRGWLEPRKPLFPATERMRLYRLLGLAPINYTFKVPGYQSVGSYYFTLQPPQKTLVMRVIGTGTGASNDTEIDCAWNGVHRHNGGRNTSVVAADGDQSGKIAAYLRPQLHEHKTIIGGALLNLLFVFFVARGRFVTGMGLTTQAWLLLTPTILTGFIAQRQRHYYALVTHVQRGMLWGYLGVSILFLIAVAFSTAYRDGEWGPKALIAFAGFAVASAGTAAFYLPQGHRYRRSLAAKMRRARAETFEEEQATYGQFVQKYCDGALKLTFSAMLAVVVAAAVMIAGGWVKAGTPPATGSAMEETEPQRQFNAPSLDTNPPPGTSPHRSAR